jgi:hypothetical protein
MSDTDADAEDLISHVCSGLAPDDREGFRQAAKAALASSPQCWGPGSLHRTLVPLWRQYFHPPLDDRSTTWSRARRTSKLNSEPPLMHGRDRRRTRPAGIRIVSGS